MMKRFILLVCFLFSSILYAETGLYTTDTIYPKAAKDIEAVLKGFAVNYPDKNILFYVHGRKKTFDSEYEGAIEMEKMYNVKVIMLRWNSWLTPFTRPVDNAKLASQLLNDSLEEFNRLKLESPEIFEGKKLFLLTHSMGNITLKNYIETFSPEKLEPTLFDRMILSGADVPFKNHHEWLEKVTFTPSLTVIMNQNDAVLKASTLLDLIDLNFSDDRLGLGFGIDNYVFFNRHAARNAMYFDITKVNKISHRHFVSKQENVKKLFHYLFMETNDAFDIPFKRKDNIVTILKN